MQNAECRMQNAKRVFVWGFTYTLSNIVQKLEQDGTCDIRFWLSTPSFAKHPKCYNILHFLNESWIDSYNEVYIKYTKNICVNEEVYSYVYKYLYKFIDMSSRQDKYYQQRDLHHYINEFNLLLNFFHAIFQKERIQATLFANIPHEGPDLILYLLCKALNIQTIILTQHPYIPNQIIYMFDVDTEYGEFFRYFERYSQEHVKIDKKITKDFFYTFKKNCELCPLIIVWRTLNIHPRRLIINILTKGQRLIRIQQYVKKLFSDMLATGQKLIRIRRYVRNIATYAKAPDFSKKYCYFALHFQPELTTSALGDRYVDQLLALQRLSELLPDDWIIYVKDHPMQTEFMRSPIFFKRLTTISKVQLVKTSVDSCQLIENAQFTSTITGTVAWESITSGKKTLVFGNTWYKHLPGIFVYSPDFNLEALLSYKIDSEDLEKKLNKMVSRMWPGVVDGMYCPIVENYSNDINTKYVSDLLTKMLFQTPIEEKL